MRAKVSCNSTPSVKPCHALHKLMQRTPRGLNMCSTTDSTDPSLVNATAYGANLFCLVWRSRRLSTKHGSPNDTSRDTRTRCAQQTSALQLLQHGPLWHPDYASATLAVNAGTIWTRTSSELGANLRLSEQPACKQATEYQQPAAGQEANWTLLRVAASLSGSRGRKTTRAV